MLRLDLKQGLSSDKLTIISNSFPNINLTDVDYLKIDLLGTLNARILIRAYLSDGSPLDLASWVSSNYFSAMIPIPTLGISFRGDIYIGLVSNDGTPSSVSITEISLIKSG